MDPTRVDRSGRPAAPPARHAAASAVGRRLAAGRAPAAATAPPPGASRPSATQRRGRVVAAVVAAFLVAGVVALLLHERDHRDSTGPTVTPTTVSPQQAALPPLPSLPSLTVTGRTTPPAGRTPDGLGTDSTLDRLAQSCYDGAMKDCDQLFKQAPAGSAYQHYGDTCADRQPVGTTTYCRVAFPS